MKLKTNQPLLALGATFLIIGMITGAIWFFGYLYSEMLMIGKAIEL